MTITTASKIHTRCQKSQYNQPSRLDTLKALLAEPGRPNWNSTLAIELRVLEGPDYEYLHYVEMEEYRKEQAAKCEVNVIIDNDDDDQRPCTFGEFDAEWD